MRSGCARVEGFARRRGWRWVVGRRGGGRSGSHRATGADARGNGEVGDDGCHGSGGDAPVRVAEPRRARGTRRSIASGFTEPRDPATSRMRWRQICRPRLIALRRVRCARGRRSVRTVATAAAGAAAALARCRPSEAAGARRRLRSAGRAADVVVRSSSSSRALGRRRRRRERGASTRPHDRHARPRAARGAPLAATRPLLEGAPRRPRRRRRPRRVGTGGREGHG